MITTQPNLVSVAERPSTCKKSKQESYMEVRIESITNCFTAARNNSFVTYKLDLRVIS